MPCGHYLCEKYQMCFHHHGQYQSEQSYFRAVKKRILAMGLKPVRAKYDEFGDCLMCGESGRCPGYHPSVESKHKAGDAAHH